MSEDWREEAACRDTDHEAFFPNPNQISPLAQKICGSCEVKQACLDWSLETRQQFGVWGGLYEQERRRLMPDGKPERTECDRGHPWRENATVSSDGYARCMACQRAKTRRRAA